MCRVPVAARSVQNEATVGMDRAAAQHQLLADTDIGGLQAHLRHDITQLHADGLVDDDAQCAALGVFTDQRDGLRKMAISQRRHGNQQLISQSTGSTHEHEYGVSYGAPQGPGVLSDDTVTTPVCSVPATKSHW